MTMSSTTQTVGSVYVETVTLSALVALIVIFMMLMSIPNSWVSVWGKNIFTFLPQPLGVYHHEDDVVILNSVVSVCNKNRFLLLLILLGQNHYNDIVNPKNNWVSVCNIHNDGFLLLIILLGQNHYNDIVNPKKQLDQCV